MAIFKNREHAAIQLAQKLEHVKDSNALVLAIPRGGVPLGVIIARHLNAELDLLFSKKIGHPFNKEYAIGAVTSLGYTLNDDCTDVDKEYIEHEISTIRAALVEKQKRLIGKEQHLILNGKTVIIVDDGIATGQTILASIELIKRESPERIIIAVPVAPTHTSSMLAKHVDQVICLHTTDNFSGIGQFYDDFTQVSDEEVKDLIKRF